MISETGQRILPRFFIPDCTDAIGHRAESRCIASLHYFFIIFLKTKHLKPHKSSTFAACLSK